MHLRQIDAVILLQDAALPYRRTHGVERYADALAGEIFGAADAAVFIDADMTMPKNP